MYWFSKDCLLKLFCTTPFVSPTAVRISNTIAAAIFRNIPSKRPNPVGEYIQNRNLPVVHAAVIETLLAGFAYTDSVSPRTPSFFPPTDPDAKISTHFSGHTQSTDHRRHLPPVGTPAETEPSFSAAALAAGDIAFALILTIQDSSVPFESSSSGNRY